MFVLFHSRIWDITWELDGAKIVLGHGLERDGNQGRLKCTVSPLWVKWSFVYFYLVRLESACLCPIPSIVSGRGDPRLDNLYIPH